MSDATAAFALVTGQQPDVVVRSPGRVNLVGEHTDYNGGFAMPMATDLGTDVTARRREDGVLRVWARRLDDAFVCRTDELGEERAPSWTRYVTGCAAVVAEASGGFRGADVVIDGDLPLGAGLSSSASLELGILLALLSLVGGDVDRLALARMGQRVEHEVIGVRSGLLDQLAVAFGEQDHALLLDCRSLDVTPLPVSTDVAVVVLDTGVPRTLAGSAYNQRRAECESALARLRADQPGVRQLRDVTMDLLTQRAGVLSEVELRRARHVVTEDERVGRAAAALCGGDVEAMGQEMTASHASLRDDYEVSCAELDLMVELAVGTDGVLGARLTGAGFGGCVVALVTAADASAVADRVAARYHSATGLPGAGFVCTPSAGVALR